THRCGHLGETDRVVAQRRNRLDQVADVLPQRGEIGPDARGEIAREQRRVVVTELLAEEGQAARQPALLYGEREHGPGVRAAPCDNDRRLDPGQRSDVTVPAGEPVEGLEWRAIGILLE